MSLVGGQTCAFKIYVPRRASLHTQKITLKKTKQTVRTVTPSPCGPGTQTLLFPPLLPKMTLLDFSFKNPEFLRHPQKPQLPDPGFRGKNHAVLPSQR